MCDLAIVPKLRDIAGRQMQDATRHARLERLQAVDDFGVKLSGKFVGNTPDDVAGQFWHDCPIVGVAA